MSAFKAETVPFLGGHSFEAKTFVRRELLAQYATFVYKLRLLGFVMYKTKFYVVQSREVIGLRPYLHDIPFHVLELRLFPPRCAFGLFVKLEEAEEEG